MLGTVVSSRDTAIKKPNIPAPVEPTFKRGKPIIYEISKTHGLLVRRKVGKQGRGREEEC